jgi:hypothetical protein
MTYCGCLSKKDKAWLMYAYDREAGEIVASNLSGLLYGENGTQDGKKAKGNG